MRLAIISQAYYPFRGGSERVAQQLAERLAARGHTVQVFTSTVEQELGFSDSRVARLPAGRAEVNGIPVIRFAHNIALQRLCTKLAPFNSNFPNTYQYDFFDALRRGPAMLGVAHAIAAWRPELIVALPASSSVLAYALWARRLTRGQAAVATVPCFHSSEHNSNHPATLSRLAQADGLAVYTQHEKLELVAQGVPAEHVTITGLGLDPTLPADTAIPARAFRERYGIGQAPIIAFVGRKQRYKGTWFLLEAMRQVWPRFPQAYLVLAGRRTSESLEMARKLTDLAAQAKSKTIWLDDFSEEDKAGLYSAADIIALPSIIDSFGVVYLEGWLYKKPVIGCRLGSTSTIIADKSDGLLVTFEDQQELAQAISDLLAYPELRTEMGEAGYRKLLASYTWDIVLDRYEQTFQDAITRARVRQEAH